MITATGSKSFYNGNETLANLVLDCFLLASSLRRKGVMIMFLLHPPLMYIKTYHSLNWSITDLAVFN